MKFKICNSQCILVINGWGISSEIALVWMSVVFTDDQSRLIQVMAWCHQATSHYLSQCWPRSTSPHGITRAQWVKFVRTTCEFALRWMQVNIGLCYGLVPSGSKSFITWTNNDPDLCWYTALRYDNEFKLVHHAAVTSITNLSHQPHYIDFHTPWLDHKTDIKT